MSRFRLGLGFNPGFLEAPKRARLPMPGGVGRLEAGTSFYWNFPKRKHLADVEHHSLHLSRAPFCEAASVQDAFVEALASKLSPRVSSIGLHLSGPYATDLGYFGLGTAFVRSPETERRSMRLLKKLVAIGPEILIENADLYPNDYPTALQSLAWSNELARAQGASLILDLAHLIVAAHNMGVDAKMLLARVDLDRVRVIHVSGIVTGRDGALHDGHSEAVDERVWTLLREVLPLLGPKLDVVLEHSDSSWQDRPEAFLADYERLRAIAVEPEVSRMLPIDREAVAIGYMANVIVPQRFPEAVEQHGRAGTSALVRKWGVEYLARARQAPERIAVLRPGDHLYGSAETTEPLADFERYLEDT